MEGASHSLSMELPDRTQTSLQPSRALSLELKTIWLLNPRTATINSGRPLKCMILMNCSKKQNEELSDPVAILMAALAYPFHQFAAYLMLHSS